MSATVRAWHPGIVLEPIDLTPPMIDAIKAALSPLQTSALTIWAEARSRFEGGRWRSNPIDAMVDVLEVIDHRARDRRWQALGHKGVCLQRWQFSCWEPAGGPDDPHDEDLLAENFEALMARAQQLLAGETPSDKLLNCLAAAESCLAGTLTPTFPPRTCHYYATWMPAQPRWAVGHVPVAARNGHLFFNTVR